MVNDDIAEEQTLILSSLAKLMNVKAIIHERFVSVLYDTESTGHGKRGQEIKLCGRMSCLSNIKFPTGLYSSTIEVIVFIFIVTVKYLAFDRAGNYHTTT